MKYIVDIKGEIEGDYEIIGKYEERPQGEWGEPFSHGDRLYHKCSNCHVSTQIIFDNYFCPNCGAKMRTEAD